MEFIQGYGNNNSESGFNNDRLAELEQAMTEPYRPEEDPTGKKLEALSRGLAVLFAKNTCNADAKGTCNELISLKEAA